MTVQTTSSKAGPFNGNGVTTVFQTGFRVDQAADLQVVHTDFTGNESVLDPSLYSAGGFGDENGVNVTYPLTGPAMPAGEVLTLLRVVSYNQQTSITNQGGFYPAVLERALDRLVYQTQQLATRIAGALRLPVSDPEGLVVDLPPASQRAGKNLGFDSQGNLIATSVSTSTISSVMLNVVQAASLSLARAALGLASGATTTVGSAASLNAGTSANNVVQLDANARLPAVDGSQVVNLAPMRNLIINGGMDIAQRGTSFVAPSNGIYTLDRFVYTFSSSVVATISQQPDAPPNNEFQNSLRFTVTTADASIAASDQATISQLIEGYNARQLIGQTFTLSFWVKSPKTGKHCVSFRNGALDRSFVTEYTVNASNTWEKKSITVNGGLITAGTWNWTNGLGVWVAFSLATGTTFQGSAGSWLSGNFIATSNQVNCLDTIGNVFALTGVQLELGAVASQFEHRSFVQEIILCQRYYEKSFDIGIFPGDNTGQNGQGGVHFVSRIADQNDRMSVAFAVSKRAAATVSIYPATLGNTTPIPGNAFDAAAGGLLAMSAQLIGIHGFTALPGANTVAGHRYVFSWVAEAEL